MIFPAEPTDELSAIRRTREYRYPRRRRRRSRSVCRNIALSRHHARQIGSNGHQTDAEMNAEIQLLIPKAFTDSRKKLHQ